MPQDFRGDAGESSPEKPCIQLQTMASSMEYMCEQHAEQAQTVQRRVATDALLSSVTSSGFAAELLKPNEQAVKFSVGKLWIIKGDSRHMPHGSRFY